MNKFILLITTIITIIPSFFSFILESNREVSAKRGAKNLYPSGQGTCLSVDTTVSPDDLRELLSHSFASFFPLLSRKLTDSLETVRQGMGLLLLVSP